MVAITPVDIALAAEAFNRAKGLTPLARRLGLELVAYTDRATGLAWPSEKRLAEALGVTTRAIRKAKVLLRRRGLVTWKQRGRHPQRTPVYELAWTALVALAKGIKERVRKAAARFTAPRAGASPSSASSTPSPSGLGRNNRSSYLSQNRYKSWDEGKKPPPRKPVQRQQGPDGCSPALLRQRAHTRLWTALTAKLSERHLGNLIDNLSKHPHIEEQALAAEQRRWHSGLPLLMQLASEKMSI